ncbi:MAG: hypothetical protein SPF91_07370 [Clostridium sp.]|nr:hypothetical protein [Clostridium sp.]
MEMQQAGHVIRKLITMNLRFDDTFMQDDGWYVTALRIPSGVWSINEKMQIRELLKQL